jgi:hypothetical protein
MAFCHLVRKKMLFIKFMNKGGFLSNNSKKEIENQNRGV